MHFRIIFQLLLALCSIINIHAQNIGIGVANPTRAKLEVWGAAGAGTTAALFGGDRGISLHRNFSAIGLNYYVDQTNIARYMGTGHAALWQYIHNDVSLAQGLGLYMYTSGTNDAALPAPNRVWNFTSNNRFQIQSTGLGGGAILDVGRGTGGDGTAVFIGTSFNTSFNFGTSENTYIRGGKGSSDVIINDITNGKVVFGNGTATLGINTNYYTPPTTLEVRQSNGGMELTNSNHPNNAWEWRVATTGSNPTFNLYYAGVLKNYFLPATGALAVSDERVKNNIENLQPVMGHIMQLQPVTYMMKDAIAGHRKSMGFLAQNVAPLFPTLVSYGMPGGNDLLGLNYSGFGVIAIKGIQEEQVQMDKMEAALNDIDNRIEAIESKLNKRMH